LTHRREHAFGLDRQKRRNRRGLRRASKHLASGDLTYQLEQVFAAKFESLRVDFLMRQ
jgi:hypothetical protein